MKVFLLSVITACVLVLLFTSRSSIAAETPFAFKSFVNDRGNAEVLVISKTDNLYFKNIIANDGNGCALPKIGVDPRWGNHPLTFNEEKSFFFASTNGSRHCGIHKLVFITNLGEFVWTDPDYVQTTTTSLPVEDGPTPPAAFSDSEPSQNRTDIVTMEVSGNTVTLTTTEDSVIVSSVVLSEKSVDIGKDPLKVTPRQSVNLHFDTDVKGQVLWILTNYGPVEKQL